MASNLKWICGTLLLMSSMGSWSGADAAIETARQDLAARLDMAVDQVAVVSRTEKTWRDGSLGCPRKGMVYKQVLVNGSELVLEAAGQCYFYHSGAGRPYFYCATPAKENGALIGAPPSMDV